eukprot:CAMPEP_0198272994 /NCGR_PEP_ID=MMETSP1447-20131203/55212_1 /TAXON_ID=420782 /ORGANISM="Chaetoceros dichaeta, Strain CCMP1751" /LENGTH=127 /DNA_ID=CAMNT_0043966471 /DNA_START=145 /DNA_END=525 /DNA_ORIENTATION=-
MIAIVNGKYFTNLRCVYELAIFCKLHQGSKLQDRLILISSTWGGIFQWLNIFHSLTRAEENWLTDFYCDRARCAVPAERQVIFSAIRKAWGSVGVFEEFVRSELLYILKESKKEHYRRPRQNIGKAM